MIHQVASGVCQPFVPTDQVRYNATGITNAGSSLIYVVCTLPGVDHTTAKLGEGTITTWVFASHSQSVAVPFACTRRSGVFLPEINTQINLPGKVLIQPGQSQALRWDTLSELSTNPNFTCALYPGVTIHYLVHYIQEEIGN